VLHRVCEDRPRPVGECTPAVPPWLVELITSLHARKAGDRIQTAEKVLEVLRCRDVPEDPTHVLRGQAGPAVEPRPSGIAGRVFAVVLGLVFLASLPAFYFLTLDDSPSANGTPQGQQAAGDTSQPAPPEPPKSPEPPGQKPEPTRPKREDSPSPSHPEGGAEEPETPRTPTQAPANPKGILVVIAGTAAGSTFLREEGVTARHQTTSETFTLNEGRNDIPLGDYKLEQGQLPAGLKITPTRFTLTAGYTVIVNINATQPPDSHLPPRVGPPPGKDDFPGPPFPPPPGHPPPPRPRNK
jgi:hypothetical protein